MNAETYLKDRLEDQIAWCDRQAGTENQIGSMSSKPLAGDRGGARVGEPR